VCTCALENRALRRQKHSERQSAAPRAAYQADVAMMSCTLLTPSTAFTSSMMALTSASCQ
jgi:hypothetical protein